MGLKELDERWSFIKKNRLIELLVGIAVVMTGIIGATKIFNNPNLDYLQILSSGLLALLLIYIGYVFIVGKEMKKPPVSLHGLIGKPNKND